MGNCIITRRVYGEAVVPKVPVLNANFPEDHTYNRVTQADPDTIELTVMISEAGIPAEYSYQWYKNGSKIDGATNENYIINSNEFTLGQTRYYCIVSSAAGNVQSRESIITFQNKPTLNGSYPVDSTLAAASGATVSVLVTSGYPTNYTYQWYKNGAIISGANSSSYNISSVAMGKTTYYCSVTNSVGTTNSRTCTITGIKTPVLTASLPADATTVASATGQATFSVKVSTQGYPTNYTYQWYKNNSPISGATSSSYTATGLTSQQTATFYCKVTNSAGTVQSRTATLTVQSYLPAYTYTGQHQLINDGNFNWRIKFLTSGTLTFSSLGSANGKGLNVFLVGGGGGGSTWYGGGAGGGYTKTAHASPTINTQYNIVVGAGGTPNGGNGNQGGTSSAFGINAAGGYGSCFQHGRRYPNRGGDGGSGGAACYWYTYPGGTNGGNGHDAYDSTWQDNCAGGRGQITAPGPNKETGNTYEFGENNGNVNYLYAGGGGTTNSNGDGDTEGGAGGGGKGRQNGVTNRGGGCGGGNTSGGSGIVVIRNAR